GPEVGVSLTYGTPETASGGVEEKFRSPRSELPTRTPGTHSPHQTAGGTSSGSPDRCRGGRSRREVVSLGSQSARVDGVRTPDRAPSFLSLGVVPGPGVPGPDARCERCSRSSL